MRYFEDIERYKALFTRREESFGVEEDVIFKSHQKMLVPEGVIIKSSKISKCKQTELLKSSKAILSRNTTDFDCSSSDSEWYAVICEKFTPVEEFKSKQRNEINRGLQNCRVEKISAKELADNGYDCYFEAFKNYKKSTIKPYQEKKFKENILLTEEFADIVHYWGVYSEGKMIAFATNYLYGNTEVSYNSIKLHPKYLHLYPMYALIYKMNEYYLKGQEFAYVNDGFRSILHVTSVQDFLIKKFGFRKVYLKLHIQYSPLFGILMKFAFPFRKFIAKFDARFNALFELERIYRKSKA